MFQFDYISTSFWVLHTPNSDQNILFNGFCFGQKSCNKGRKATKVRHYLAEKKFFQVSTPMLVLPDKTKTIEYTVHPSCYCPKTYSELLFCAKKLKKNFFNNVWNAQHPNTGQNIRQ